MGGSFSKIRNEWRKRDRKNANAIVKLRVKTVRRATTVPPYGKSPHKPYGVRYTGFVYDKLTVEECRAKCDQDEDCIVFGSKENEWCTTYRTCDLQAGDQWGVILFGK